MAIKPKAILCDVNGTLFSLDALGVRMEQIGLSKNLLPVRQILCSSVIQFPV